MGSVCVALLSWSSAVASIHIRHTDMFHSCCGDIFTQNAVISRRVTSCKMLKTTKKQTGRHVCYRTHTSSIGTAAHRAACRTGLAPLTHVFALKPNECLSASAADVKTQISIHLQRLPQPAPSCRSAPAGLQKCCRRI